MKVETKKIDGAKIQLDIHVPAETVKNKFDEIYKKIGREAKIPGFRPGKAPRDILERHHHRLAQEEVIKDLIPQAYQDSLEKEKINVVDSPQISQVKLEANVLSFQATVEMRPEIEVKNYKNIKLSHKKITVTPEDVDRTLDALKKAHKIDSVDEKFAKRLGYKTVTEMRSSIEKQLFVQKENELRYKLQEDLLKEILGQVSFKLPQALVNRQLEELARQAKLQLIRRGATKEQIASQEVKLREELLPEAQNQVKTYLVLEEIAKKENIPQDDEHLSQKVIEFLLGEANWITADAAE